MATIEDKENVMPATSSDPLQSKASLLSPRRSGRKGRSKSIGPGSLDEPEPPIISAKDRRKSAFVPATKSILAKNEESEKAARRKSMMNRRVSFAPEATLHTWDIVEYAKDHTTSTDDTESTRRASAFSRSSASPRPSSDASRDDEDAELLNSPEAGPDRKSMRRSSGIPPMNFNNPHDAYSSSGVSASEDESGSDDEEGESEDDTGTAMSLDVDDATIQSAAGSEDSTGSSARLEASLKQAAQAAGTRGIEYDEFGEMSMELVSEEVTNAFKPWAQQQPNEPQGSASLDQENVNPFSPVFRKEIQAQQAPISEEGEDDMSMDMTRAIGGILRSQPAEKESSPVSEGDETMELTQAIGKIHGQKKRHSTTEAGSPGSKPPAKQAKRRRSSVARSSMGDDTMDLTMVVGGIRSTTSPVKTERRRSLRNRRSSGAVSEQDNATMEFTQAIGGIKKTNASNGSVDDSFDGNEDLSMELTTVLGGIRPGNQTAKNNGSRQTTPQLPQSPVRSAANTTPKDQERFRDTLDMGAAKLLTPILEKQLEQSASHTYSSKRRQSFSPAKLTGEAQQQTSTPPVEPVAEAETGQDGIPRLSPAKDNVAYPELPAIGERPSPVRTPTPSPQRRQGRKSPTAQGHERPTVLLQAPDQSPIAAKIERSSPARAAASTPERTNASEDSRDLTESIKLMTTPRKEALKSVTPKKSAPAKQISPVKSMTPRARPMPKSKEPARELPSPARRLHEDLKEIKANAEHVEKVGLQDFLAKAGIRFMDLTTTKRRLTTAPTPSRTRDSAQDEEVSLESGVVAAACTVPELELYQHACHELKRYTKEGKQMIAQLEAATIREQPPLLQAYVHASPDRKAALDAQMREMKTDARYRSKELWYVWRSQLLDELMGGLQNIGEGLIKDDEVIGRSEETLEQLLPTLTEKHHSLQQEAERLEESVNAVSEEEKEELNATRMNLSDVNSELAEKRRLLESLRKQVEEQDYAAEHLRESKDEFQAAIQEANRVREACRGVSLSEIKTLKESVKHLEETYGWSIASASSSPATLTMTYKSELQLFFHPRALSRSSEDSLERPNAPIGLTYIEEGKKPMTTTLRFFLQFLRACLQGLPQCTTKISALLGLVSSGWDTASSVAEAERRLNLETLTESRIVSDEQLAVEAQVLLAKVKTKVRATFDVSARLVEDGDELKVDVRCEPRVTVVYGEQYNERNMGEFLKNAVGDGVEGWDDAVRGMREKLIARGAKGSRK
ncbi:Hypothetical predicted protein [Lecanosticta acicola]|uniref:Spc7 kinetochore protein domain-containing protein n=1 Tax=Lecanosticta acicola TaxID=111012 RepID=A0AAI9EC33_9PEZI|nr:Hypothetical predicted protein [Lecanosticta acicola]